MPGGCGRHEALPDMQLRAEMPGVRRTACAAPGGPSAQVVWSEPVPGPKSCRRARKSRKSPSGGAVTLRVQARNAAGDIFASCLAAPDVAWRIALEWIEQLPGLTVEVVGFYE